MGALGISWNPMSTGYCHVERYWGTPLPICFTGNGEDGSDRQLSGVAGQTGVDGTQIWEEAKAAQPELVDDLRVHKPYIDSVTYASPFSEARTHERVTEVIDCWYDSDAMPFAQWGWPHQNADRFKDQFPADFISAVPSRLTRGWFYSQLAISTMLFGEGSKIADEGFTAADPHSSEILKNNLFPILSEIASSSDLLGEDGNKMSKSETELP